MSHRTSLPQDWKPLLDKVGGVLKLCEALNLTYMQLYRRFRTSFSESDKTAVRILCNMMRVKPPNLDAPPVETSPRREIPDEWKPLVDHFGGVKNLAPVLGLSVFSLYRRIHGQNEVRHEEREKIKAVCGKYKLPCPRFFDLGPLELYGAALERGFPPSMSEMARLQKLYSEEDLVAIAEMEDADPKVLRAASQLLGL